MYMSSLDQFANRVFRNGVRIVLIKLIIFHVSSAFCLVQSGEVAKNTVDGRNPANHLQGGPPTSYK